jgi:integrase
MGRQRKHDGGVYKRSDGAILWMWYRDRGGERQQESTETSDWEEAHRRLRQRLEERDSNTLAILRKGEQLGFREWSEFFLENYSHPPIRAEKTHEANMRAIKHLNAVFGEVKLVEFVPDEIELYLRSRLRQRVKIQTLGGLIEKEQLKPSTVHQEFRVLRRILNVAVKKKRLRSNPCDGVEFPVKVDGLFRPHYVTWSEQQRIEEFAPIYLRHIVRIITETGLRIRKELLSARKDQVDFRNLVFWIPDSKTPSGRAELPLTEFAADAFRSQIEAAGPGNWLFPSADSESGHLETVKKSWRKTLENAGLPYFRIYDLRSTFGTRLSAGGVSDEWVTQMLRQGDAKVFKKYSRMKLQMRREALGQLDRLASERNSVTVLATEPDSATVLLRSQPKRHPASETIARKHSRIKESA